MTSAIVITGTDTGIGKTVFSAGLTLALGATYWKPIQSGLEEETDSQTVTRLTGRPALPEAYRLREPASPHYAAACEGVEIAPMPLPDLPGPVVIEGAGGVLVPLRGSYLYADLMAEWRAPVIVIARTALGTINHSLLSVEALRARNVPILGLVFIGDEVPDSQSTICRIAGLPSLGRLPIIPDLTTGGLSRAFGSIDLATIRAAL